MCLILSYSNGALAGCCYVYFFDSVKCTVFKIPKNNNFIFSGSGLMMEVVKKIMNRIMVVLG